MSQILPPYYFRVRENGATVFRVSTDNRHRRIEMDQIAVINTRNGTVRPKNGIELTEEDQTEIDQWMSKRTEILKKRDIDDIHRAVDYLNLTTQWAQSSATDDELEEVTDALLMAMHDLRSVLVRKKSHRLNG
ncbi:hypothetical protein AAD018_012305 [Aestuariibius insulae]|uniref:hypothetical protein n=1 Tax=Aestuariibius insulae TaxID=2058287 RepID=UPI00345E7713